MHEQQERIDSL